MDERYVKYEQRINGVDNSTGRTLDSNEIKYDANIDMNGNVNMVQVNYCNEWHENSNEYSMSPTISESNCSYTEILSNSSRSTSSENHTDEQQHDIQNSNSHTLNIEHNRPYKSQQCAYQNQLIHKYSNNTNDKCTTQTLFESNTKNSHAKINIQTSNNSNINQDIEIDNSNSACAVHTFVNFTHTQRNNSEVNSLIEPKTCDFYTESTTQDITKTDSAHCNTFSSSNESKDICESSKVLTEKPLPFSKSSSFVEPLSVDNTKSVDSFHLQADWDAGKNKNPSYYKDNRTKALPLNSIENDDFEIVNDKTIKTIDFHCANHLFKLQNNVNSLLSEQLVPITQSKSKEKSIHKKFNTSLSCAASTTPLNFCNADNNNENVAHIIKTKICLTRNSEKSQKCKFKYSQIVSNCYCEQNKRHLVGKTRKLKKNKFYEKRREQSGQLNKYNNKKQTNNQHENINRNNRNCVGKQLKKYCRGSHLVDFDLYEPVSVTSKSTAKRIKQFPSHNTFENISNTEISGARKPKKIEKDNGEIDDRVNFSHHILKHNSSGNQRTYNITHKACDGVESLKCDTKQSTAINITCTDTVNDEKNDLTTPTRCISDLVDVNKIKISIGKIEQVLDAVKSSDNNRTIVLCDSDNQNKNNKKSVKYTGNSLKNSLNLSESCDSIFTHVKRTISTSSSLLSLNGFETFEASNRLRRLEERFKDFAITSLGKKDTFSNDDSSNISTLLNPIHSNQDKKSYLNYGKSEKEYQTSDINSFNRLQNQSISEDKFHSIRNSHVNDEKKFSGLLENCESISDKFSDSNNNHISTKTNSKHVCCSHTVKRRSLFDNQCEEYTDKSALHSFDIELEKRKSPIGNCETQIDDNTQNFFLLNTTDETGELNDAKNTNLDYSNKLNESLVYLPITEYIESQKQQEENPNRKLEALKSENSLDCVASEKHIENHITHNTNIENNLEKVSNDESQFKCTKQEKNVSIKEENRPNNCNDKAQLDDIVNRLVNCTPVSISTESEEIYNLFPENRYNFNESPFIYRNEELKTKCIFDVKQLIENQLPQFDHIYECYDELEDDIDDSDIQIFDLNINHKKGM